MMISFNLFGLLTHTTARLFGLRGRFLTNYKNDLHLPKSLWACWRSTEKALAVTLRIRFRTRGRRAGANGSSLPARQACGLGGTPVQQAPYFGACQRPVADRRVWTYAKNRAAARHQPRLQPQGGAHKH